MSEISKGCWREEPLCYSFVGFSDSFGRGGGGCAKNSEWELRDVVVVNVSGSSPIDSGILFVGGMA